MKSELNSYGCLILYLDDGTEIIFSDEATKRIQVDKEHRAKQELELILKDNVFVQKED